MLRHIGICVLTLALLAGPAIAADNDLPPPDPADAIYTITLEADIPNTARCLGDLSTPLCALETFIACKEIPDMRRNPICGQVGYQLPPPPTGEIREYLDSRPVDPTIYRIAIYYRVHASLWPSPAMVKEIQHRFSHRPTPPWILPGDGIVLVQHGMCVVPAENACKLRVKGYTIYALYKAGGVWRVRGRDVVPGIPALREALMLPNSRM